MIKLYSDLIKEANGYGLGISKDMMPVYKKNL